ncbi:Late competence protein ComEA, DNA receptor [Streptococcus sp. DD11]|uniref:helix-hairpin-helix domain-containing protein n=1 Tax=Streptococcus sp. DD11 TaxID=1777879 RepID=UPI000798176E|nr:helix-hairpin-helix domain-containing protein [Streptococcus sp. DD11]KXT82557.1 Late competence protein ComEA, DNA receptor [Streptococcus sp. DD11]
MLEEIIEKIKEYKLFAGLALAGLLLAGFFLVRGSGEPAPEKQVSALAQEVIQSSASSDQIDRTEQSEVRDSESSSELTVDVKGEVKHPGVYQLKAGSRIYDAIQKAGGMTAEADSKSVNLAQKLADEAVVYVTKIGEGGADVTAGTAEASSQAAASRSAQSDLINLNTATEAELQTITGIGQKRAQDIIAYRESNGGFKSVDDLKNVSGIGDKTLEKLKEYVTVD